jgi:transcriptional regulator with XRE-family HTH domain
MGDTEEEHQMAIDAKRAPDRGRDDQDAADRAVLGAKIRALRNDAGLTINALAAGAGVSSSLISQVERGVAEPSLSSLRRIANFLDAPVASLFVGNEDVPADSSNRRGERLVVRAGGRKLLKAPESDMTYELLQPDLSGRLCEIIQVEFPPGSRMPEEPVTHSGEESTVVLTGELVAFHDGEEFTLHAGDTISWNPEIEHWIENRGSKPATVITVVSPPTF